MNRYAEIAEKLANWWLQEGDILYSMLPGRGHPHFYQVIFAGDDLRVDIREIGIRIVGEDTVAPIKGRFIGQVMRVPVSSGGEARIGATEYAMPWKGHPVMVGNQYSMVAGGLR